MSSLSDATDLLQPCPLSVVWAGPGRSRNGPNMQAGPKSHPPISALLSPLLKQSHFVNHLCGLAWVYKLHKEAFGITNCICTA